MATMDAKLEKNVQQGFRVFNRFMVLLWRLGLGTSINIWPDGTGRIMVITHTGRKSGLPRRTPVNYAIVNNEIYCTAGFGPGSDWYRNVKTNPKVQVWLPDGWYDGVAEEVTHCPEHTALIREVLIASGFAARAFGINPKTFSDGEIEQATANYRLMHIHRTAARTGPDGPGDLVWVWPVIALLLFLTRPVARRRKR